MLKNSRPVATLMAESSNKPLYMVIVCTLFASAAQVLMKIGTGHEMPKVDPAHLATLVDFAVAFVKNVPLIGGFALHGCNALLLILALRTGQLSILMPLYSLSYVWVALLSALLFGDRINAWRVGGIALIIVGVWLLGRAGSVVAAETAAVAE